MSPLKVYRRIPWIIAFCALLSSFANFVMGIIILATNHTGGDIALGVLTLVFGVWGVVGSLLALIFILRQNTYNLSQSRFMAQVSHELRTPITSIRMYADTLLMHRFKDAAEEDELIHQMNAEIVRLERLTEQILESRSQKPISDLAPINLANTLRDTLSPFLSDPANQARLAIDIDEAVPEMRMDPNDFTNAISNLVRNALTHGGDGHVYVSLLGEGEKCVVSVRDEGEGIAPDMRRKIFEPFERGANTTESGIPGFGLGLSIVRDFAKKYRASLKVDNHPEGGAIFTITFRVHRD